MNTFILVCLAMVLFLGGCYLWNSLYHTQQKALVGLPAPDFTLSDAQGTRYSLHNFRGSKVALYFYPKDDTPGCTTEACNIRDNFNALRENGIVPIGISYDSPSSHTAFADKYQLPFILLSDIDKKVAHRYGTGQSWLPFAQRITFLINEDGVIVARIDKVDVKNHTQQILNGFGLL
jgi:peroxiredoxin Q/BCP